MAVAGQPLDVLSFYTHGLCALPHTSPLAILPPHHDDDYVRNVLRNLDFDGRPLYTFAQFRVPGDPTVHMIRVGAFVYFAPGGSQNKIEIRLGGRSKVVLANAHIPMIDISDLTTSLGKPEAGNAIASTLPAGRQFAYAPVLMHLILSLVVRAYGPDAQMMIVDHLPHATYVTARSWDEKTQTHRTASISPLMLASLQTGSFAPRMALWGLSCLVENYADQDAQVFSFDTRLLFKFAHMQIDEFVNGANFAKNLREDSRFYIARTNTYKLVSTAEVNARLWLRSVSRSRTTPSYRTKPPIPQVRTLQQVLNDANDLPQNAVTGMLDTTVSPEDNGKADTAEARLFNLISMLNSGVYLNTGDTVRVVDGHLDGMKIRSVFVNIGRSMRNMQRSRVVDLIPWGYEAHERIDDMTRRFGDDELGAKRMRLWSRVCVG